MSSRLRWSRPPPPPSHFEVEVPLQRINLSPPPPPAASAASAAAERGMVFVPAEFTPAESASAARLVADENRLHHHGEAGAARQSVLSEDTRRLLREVENIRRRTLRELEAEKRRKALQLPASESTSSRLDSASASAPLGRRLASGSSDKENRASARTFTATDSAGASSSSRKRKVADIVGKRAAKQTSDAVRAGVGQTTRTPPPPARPTSASCSSTSSTRAPTLEMSWAEDGGKKADKSAQTDPPKDRKAVVFADERQKRMARSAVRSRKPPPAPRSRSEEGGGSSSSIGGGRAKKRSKSAGEVAKTDGDEGADGEKFAVWMRDHRKSLRERRAAEKPWRHNMRKKPVERAVDAASKAEQIDGDGDQVDEDEDDARKKPWRHNMRKAGSPARKAGTEEQAKGGGAAEGGAKKVAKSPSSPPTAAAEKSVVRRYIRQKRQRGREERRRREAEAEARREDIRNRLAALEVERRRNYINKDQLTATKSGSSKTDVKNETQKTEAEIIAEQRLLRRTLEDLSRRIRKETRDDGNADAPRPPRDRTNEVVGANTGEGEVGGGGSERINNVDPSDDARAAVATPESQQCPSRSSRRGDVGRDRRGGETPPAEPAESSSNWALGKQGRHASGEAGGGHAASAINEAGGGQMERKAPPQVATEAAPLIGADDEERVPVRDESAEVPRGVEKRRRMLSEVFARHQRDLEYVKRLSEDIKWQQQQQQQQQQSRAQLDYNHGLNFIAAVRRKKVEVCDFAPPSNRSSTSQMARFPKPAEKIDRIDKPNVTKMSPPPVLSPSSVPPPPGSVPAKREQDKVRATEMGANEVGDESRGERVDGRGRRRLGDSSESSNARSMSNDGLGERQAAMAFPSALRLRFMAELNQLEAMQELEKHLANVKHMHSAAAANTDAANMALYLKDSEARRDRKLKARSENRRQFEERLRNEFQEILANKVDKILTRQAEIGRAKSEASEQLSRLGIGGKTSEERTPSTAPTSVAPSSPRRQDPALASLMSSAESRLPAAVEAVQQTERSGRSLPNTISEALQALSSKLGSSSSTRNVTEDLARELSGTTTTAPEEEVDDDDETAAVLSSKLDSESTIKEEEEVNSSRRSTVRTETPINSRTEVVEEEEEEPVSSRQEERPTSVSEQRTLVPSSSSVSLMSEDDASRRDGNGGRSVSPVVLLMRHLEEESARAKLQYEALKQRERDLVERAKEELARLEEKKRQLRAEGDGGRERKISSIKKRERAVLLDLKGKRADIDRLKETLRASERERKGILKQNRNVLGRDAPSPVAPKSAGIASSPKQERDGASSKTGDYRVGLSSVDESTDRKRPEAKKFVDETKDSSESEHSQGKGRAPPSSPSKMQSLKKSLGATLKTPLSPKSSGAGGGTGAAGRRRHSSAESEDSVSLSQSEEHSSDMEIRLGALRDELTQRMRTAARLKQQQRQKHREKMRAQEVTLSRQIEQYDRLIQEARRELEETESMAASAAATAISLAVVPPQIKTPRQATSPVEASQRRLSLDEASLSTLSTPARPTAEELLSPQRSPATESISEKASNQSPREGASPGSSKRSLGGESADANYSDDFTSSSASVLAEAEKEAPTGRKDDAVAEDAKREKQAETIANKILEDVVIEACHQLSIIRSRRRPDAQQRPRASEMAKQSSGDSTSSSAAAAATRSRPQDLMLTTFDISSESSDDGGVDRRKAESPQAPREDLSSPAATTPASDGGGDNFIDDDFGLSSIRRESEQIRQQQLLIEQEIDRIQQETGLQTGGTAAVPSKPPPPYTPPPAASTASSPPSQSGRVLSPRTPTPVAEAKPEVRHIPSRPEEVEAVVDAVAKEIFKAQTEEGSFDHVKDKLMAAARRSWVGQHGGGGDGKARDEFLEFLCELSLEVSGDVYRCQRARQNPPWLPQLPLAKERLGLPPSAAALSRRVSREALVLLGQRRRAAREDLVVRWSQKRRDRVDQILVRELHGEEAAWTDYAADAVAVKDQVADAVLELLLADAAREVADVWGGKH